MRGANCVYLRQYLCLLEFPGADSGGGGGNLPVSGLLSAPGGGERRRRGCAHGYGAVGIPGAAGSLVFPPGQLHQLCKSHDGLYLRRLRPDGLLRRLWGYGGNSPAAAPGAPAPEAAGCHEPGGLRGHRPGAAVLLFQRRRPGAAAEGSANPALRLPGEQCGHRSAGVPTGNLCDSGHGCCPDFCGAGGLFLSGQPAQTGGRDPDFPAAVWPVPGGAGQHPV